MTSDAMVRAIADRDALALAVLELERMATIKESLAAATRYGRAAREAGESLGRQAAAIRTVLAAVERPGARMDGET